ncbi:MAG: VOC family protein [Actinomycetaceae bacterium]
MAGFHHVEVWLADARAAMPEWAWLLTRLGLVRESRWPDGESWSNGGAYLTLTTPPTMTDSPHDRRRPGVNHLAFVGGPPNKVDALMADAPDHGWRPLYHERYPHAGGPDHYAGWLENSDGFKIEIVASNA